MNRNLIRNRNGMFVVLNILFVLLLILLTIQSAQAQGGYTLDFDGTDDYVSIPDDADLRPTSAITVEAWFYPKDISGQSVPPVLRKANSTSGYTLEISHTTDQIMFFVYISGVGFTSSPTYVIPSLNEWYHVAGTYDGSDVSLYINGELIGSTSQAGSITQSTEPLIIGSESFFGGRYFDGKIDEVRIWSDARTQAEIQANMHKELVGNEANLVAYYQMSDGTGTSLTDNSTNSNTGTFSGVPSWKTSDAHAGPDMALSFDGSDDEVHSTITMTPTDTFTLEAWMKFASLTGKQSPLDFQQAVSGAQLTVSKENTTNLLTIFIDDGTSTTTMYSSVAIAANQWYHLAIVYAEKQVLLYVNGVQTMNGSTALSYRTTAGNDFYIGASDGSSHSEAIIDEVRIWDDIRSQSEILSGMFRTLEGDESNLVAYYRFDQQPAVGNTTLYDYSVNGLDGTLSNMDATTDWVASSPFNTWIGSEDSDWSNGDNWSSGSVPSTEDVGVYGWPGSNSPASGNISGRNVYIDTDASVSHSGNLTISNNFFNAGTFSTSGSLTFSGSSMQFIAGSGASTFDDLVVNNGAGVALAQNLTVSSTLTFSNGIVILNGNTLTLGSSAAVSGTPGGSNHINATTGSLRKDYSGTGSFEFPVGDGTNYSPITLNFTSGTFATGSTSVGLTDGKHSSNSSTTDYITRYWTVGSSGISDFSCAVTAEYIIGDVVGTESNLYGGKYSSGDWTILDPVNTGTHEISGTVTGFSDFTAGEATAFPVEWLHFNAYSEGNVVLLDWATARETNSDFFAIERSVDQEQWNELGIVTAAGNSTETREYQFEDVLPLIGKTFYRLRQVDLDGAFDLSSVVELYLGATEVATYPNPVQDKLMIEMKTASPIKAILSDTNGRIVLETRISGQNPSLDLSELPAGIYVLRLADQKGWNWQEQIVKE